VETKLVAPKVHLIRDPKRKGKGKAWDVGERMYF